MEEKKCPTCKRTLCVTEFEFKDKQKERRSSWCKSCTRAYKKRHYSANKNKYLHNATISNYNRRFNIRKEIWKHLESHPCVDCGETDPIVMEFDHRDPSTKKYRVSQMVTKMLPIEEIMQEIAKCDVRCANCHRRKTAKQFLWHEHPDEIAKLPRRKYRSSKKEMSSECNQCGNHYSDACLSESVRVSSGES